jgi:hypothetical protein
MGTLHEDQYTFFIILGSVFVERELFQTTDVEVIKTFFCSITFFSENSAIYETMWENIVEPDRPKMTIWRTRIACRGTKATHTHNM